jgi:hypothetical protein
MASPAGKSESITPPHAPGVEKSVLSAVMRDPALIEAHGIVPSLFHLPSHRRLLEVFKQFPAGDEIDIIMLASRLNESGEIEGIGGPSSIADIYGHEPGTSRIVSHVSELRKYQAKREAISLSEKLLEAALSPCSSDELAEVVSTGHEAIVALARTENNLSEIEAREFNFDSHPEKPVPVFSIARMPLSTPGNITNIQAPPKAGKSAVVDAMIASVLNWTQQGTDTLGFQAENPLARAVIHFDTEQSRFDADAIVRRACRRARVERPPSWFHSYSVADLTVKQRRQGLGHAMASAEKNHGGILAVLIDGIGDLCADPNNSEEAFELVQELHSLAIKHDCTIQTVLHENPGSETGKTRGHLGSQLERKAETNLRLAKDGNGVTTIWAERARHCYLPKSKGPCFVWSHAAGMHVSCGTANDMKAAADREKMMGEAEEVFSERESFRHCDLMAAIAEALTLKERAAKARIQKWAAEGIIAKDTAGNYRLSTP